MDKKREPSREACEKRLRRQAGGPNRKRADALTKGDELKPSLGLRESFYVLETALVTVPTRHFRFYLLSWR
jgi:hypothetical protein